MATKAARGTKRTCQNSDCGQRFYDLGRSPIVCPECDSPYVIASAPLMANHVVEEAKPAKVFDDADAVAPSDAPEVEAAELADIEPAEEAVAAEEDATFLEEEEDEGGDVSGIIGGHGEDEEES